MRPTPPATTTPVQPESPAARAPSGFLVVGIGASAGGFEALQEFFSAVPADTGLAFVVISHQRPGQASLLPQLLGKRAKIPAVQATDGMRVEPDRLYLAPPGSYMALRARRLIVPEPPAVDARQGLPIDHFFRSLAEDLGPRQSGRDLHRLAPPS